MVHVRGTQTRASCAHAKRCGAENLRLQPHDLAQDRRWTSSFPCVAGQALGSGPQ
jgi:hypothetical protein